jgi:flagellar biosynthesis protein FliP
MGKAIGRMPDQTLWRTAAKPTASRTSFIPNEVIVPAFLITEARTAL